MKIGELAREADVSPSKIRYYESEGLLARPGRQSGRRMYGREAVPQLRAISALQNAGFRLTEIRELLPTSAGGTLRVRWVHAAQAKLKELDDTIADLISVRKRLSTAIDCVCDGDPMACDLVSAPSCKHGRSARVRRARDGLGKKGHGDAPVW